MDDNEREALAAADPLDPDACYRAIASRDPRFDGRFFTGVTTTGIYCRPVCPARTPKRENVLFFACAAAAEAAGFRPCRRCRPETAPGTPAWIGSAATVSRALRLIGEGALDGDSGGVGALARRLGVGARHLSRLFARHLGAAPIAVAQTRRVHFARELVGSTDLAISRVAFCSGFSSVRRFNAAMKAAFGRSPSEMRERRGGARAAADGALEFRLAYRPPYDFDALLGFLRQRAIPGVESIDGSRYRRAFRVGETTGTLEVAHAEDERSLRLRVAAAPSRDLVLLVERVRRLFDLGADPLRIALALSRDPRLAPLVAARPGLRVPGAWDGFETAVRAILGQQVSVAAATTLAGRLAREFGSPLGSAAADGLTHLFPGPATLATADIASRLPLQRSRADAIKALARALRDGALALDAARGLDDAVARLRALPGIGEWTAQVVALRVFGEPDAFPAGDLGIRRALGLDAEKDVLREAEAWRPWRAYAALHLWNRTPPSAAAKKTKRRRTDETPRRNARLADRPAGARRGRGRREAPRTAAPARG